jgi:hypothetical protein
MNDNEDMFTGGLYDLPPGVPAGRMCRLNADGTWSVETEAEYAARMARRRRRLVWVIVALLGVAAFLVLPGCSSSDGEPTPEQTGGMTLDAPTASPSLEPAMQNGTPATVVDEFLVAWNGWPADEQQRLCDAYHADQAAVLDAIEQSWVPDPHPFDRGGVELAMLGVCY